MKKICAILCVVLLFSFMMVSCDKTDKNQEEVKRTTAVECITGFLNSDNEEALSRYVTQLPEGFAESILEAFPEQDYIITAEKLGDYEGYELYSVNVKRTGDSQYTKKYFEVLKNTEDGYLIETDTNVLMNIEKDCLCKKCQGRGSLAIIGKGEIPCDGCNGKSFIFE